MMPLIPRDQPRRLAPILFGLFDIAAGVAGYHASAHHVPTYRYLTDVMSLNDWSVSFIALGLLILAGTVWPRVTVVSAPVAVAWWMLWATLISETIGQPGVSPRAAATTYGIAALHLLISPYHRRK